MQNTLKAANFVMTLILPVFWVLSCTDVQEQLDEREVYDGAFHEVADSELWYSDSGVVRLMVKTAKMLEYFSVYLYLIFSRILLKPVQVVI